MTSLAEENKSASREEISVEISVKCSPDFVVSSAFTSGSSMSESSTLSSTFSSSSFASASASALAISASPFTESASVFSASASASSAFISSLLSIVRSSFLFSASVSVSEFSELLTASLSSLDSSPTVSEVSASPAVSTVKSSSFDASSTLASSCFSSLPSAFASSVSLDSASSFLLVLSSLSTSASALLCSSALSFPVLSLTLKSFAMSSADSVFSNPIFTVLSYSINTGYLKLSTLFPASNPTSSAISAPEESSVNSYNLTLYPSSAFAFTLTASSAFASYTYVYPLSFVLSDEISTSFLSYTSIYSTPSVFLSRRIRCSWSSPSLSTTLPPAVLILMNKNLVSSVLPVLPSVDVDICVTVPSSFTVISLAYAAYEDSIGDAAVIAAIATDMILFFKLFIVSPPVFIIFSLPANKVTRTITGKSRFLRRWHHYDV